MNSSTKLPEIYITLDPPEANVASDKAYYMVVRAETSARRAVVPKQYVATDMLTLTDDVAQAVHVNFGWKYQHIMDWRAVASNALSKMRAKAVEAGYEFPRILLD